MTVWVYVLRSERNARQYVGISAHLQRRVRQHNCGKNVSTLAGIPWRLVYREQCSDYARARERERFLKSGEGRAFLDTLVGQRSPPASGG
jgi:putative endonuclease